MFSLNFGPEPTLEQRYDIERLQTAGPPIVWPPLGAGATGPQGLLGSTLRWVWTDKREYFHA